GVTRAIEGLFLSMMVLETIVYLGKPINPMLKEKYYFSYSQLSTFKSCRELYKIIYIDGVRKEEESIEAFMGKCVHSVLEWLYQKENVLKPYITFDSICQKYDDIWINLWHDKIYIVENRIGVDYYYSMGKRCLSNYYYKYGPTFDEYVIGTEVETEFELEEGIGFRGVIDRLDQPKPGKYYIHDYKTGKHPLTINSAKNNLQLVIYHISILENFQDVVDITLNWHFLRQGIEVSVVHSEDEITMFRKKLKRQVNQIRDLSADLGNFYPRESALCNWCYYWEECSVKYGKNPVQRAE
ncbi:MAG: RecB family exonuclease, partial [Fidelibacterota bacterium]